jgi:hypothetical protein
LTGRHIRGYGLDGIRIAIGQNQHVDIADQTRRAGDAHPAARAGHDPN